MEQNGRKVVELNIDDVLPNRFQPRIKFNEEAINELSKSIQEHGVIQPIVVRPIGDKYEIIAGERRYKASCLANLKTIPAILTDLNDKDSAEVALIENVQRENLTPIEEAISYKKILDMGYITQDALAIKLGKTQSTVANKLRLLNLDDEVQEALLKEKISERHARSLLKLTDKEQQRQMLKRIIGERLPVRRTDEEIEKMLHGDETLSQEDIVENVQPFIFEQLTNNFQPSVDSTIENTPHDEPVVASKSEFKFFNINQEEPTITPIVEEQYNETLKPESITSQEPEEIKPSKFFNILEAEGEKEKETKNTPQNFDFNSLFMNPVISENVANSHNILLNEIEEIENSINNSNTIEPIEEETQPKRGNEPLAEDLDFIEEEQIEEEQIGESIEEVKSEEVEPTSLEEPRIKNFKDALQSIRNCSNKIESAGFVIDTEEYDLEGMYQVIFKITKQ